VKENPEKSVTLLSKLLDLVREEIPSSRALFLVINRKNEVVFKKAWKMNEAENDGLSSTVIRRALEKKHPILISNLEADPCFGHDKSIFRKDWGSILCLPLIIENKPVAAIYLDRKTGLDPFSTQNLELLTVLSRPIHFILGNNFEFKDLKEEDPAGVKDFLIGQSKALRRIRNLVERVKDSSAPVLICGESGTGKELIARAIHHRGARRKGQFVAVNCGAIPDHLLESELFGHVKGAFTGALRDKAGLIEEASGGTFFLDEIGDLTLQLQAKLLRLIQEKEIRRVGENRTRSVDVRFISATNKDIEKETEQKNFREDLYYRLRIVTIEIPPLRERKEDLILLLDYFVDNYCQEMKRERAYFSPRCLELLINYSWPGNVRELQNEIQRCLIFSGEDNFIREEYLSPKINPQGETSQNSSFSYSAAKAEFESRFLREALHRCDYNKSKTAEEIGLSRQGLFKLMKKHGIEAKRKS